MVHTYAFHDVGRLPAPGDNVAIASRRLPAGTQIANGGATFVTSHTILEGHRFALCDIAAGDTLLSWGLPFGVANRDIAPGTYVCNHAMYGALAMAANMPESPRAGFIHIPQATENIIDATKPSLTLLEMTEAIKRALSVCALHTSDIASNAGDTH